MIEINEILLISTIAITGTGLGYGLGYISRKKTAEKKIKSAEIEAARILAEVKKDAETKRKETLLETKEEVHQIRLEFEKESRERRNEIQKLERRNLQREENLDRKLEDLEKKEQSIRDRKGNLDAKEKEVNVMHEKQLEELERISGLTTEEAKNQLLMDIENEVKKDAVIMMKDIENQAKDEANKKAKSILAHAIQKFAADQVNETTVSTVSLPNDEMKGRIIGREGRNIRAIEKLTGVDLIIDDTPETVALSCFNPIRREIARIAVEKLIQDGRIHPTRIEEMVNKAKKEMDEYIKEIGETASFDVGIHNLHPKLVKLIGRLKYRTSYGQNVLQHSIEVAYLASIMAEEIGADVNITKRAGLLHDIGKALDHEIEGTHIEIGMNILKKYKESSKIIDAMKSHHGDFEHASIEGILVTAADAISAARPGARKETLNSYIKRLESLENIATEFDGVEKSYAIQAGREIRIIVMPEKISDDDIYLLAKNIKKKIENQLDYPGQIKINIIRETRATEYAK